MSPRGYRIASQVTLSRAVVSHLRCGRKCLVSGHLRWYLSVLSMLIVVAVTLSFDLRFDLNLDLSFLYRGGTWALTSGCTSGFLVEDAPGVSPLLSPLVSPVVSPLVLPLVSPQLE